MKQCSSELHLCRIVLARNELGTHIHNFTYIYTYIYSFFGCISCKFGYIGYSIAIQQMEIPLYGIYDEIVKNRSTACFWYNERICECASQAHIHNHSSDYAGVARVCVRIMVCARCSYMNIWIYERLCVVAAHAVGEKEAALSNATAYIGCQMGKFRLLKREKCCSDDSRPSTVLYHFMY